jgi:nucleoside-diphosphate-sugar epimerase
MKERVFVTGATGMVGFHVVKHLLSAGYEVVAAARSQSKAADLLALAPQGQLTIAHLDLLETENLAEFMQGCPAVVHCAGAVDPHAKRADIMRTNVDGTRNALNAAIKAGGKQFIHVSSLSVITGQDDQFNVDESAPLRYCGEAYADSKVDSEKVVQEHASQIGTTILRPGFIYGPGERAWMQRLLTNLKNGKVMLIDGGTRQTNVIYVNNLAKAVELSLLNSKSYGQVYNLTDEKTPTKKELFDTMCDAMGYPHVTKQISRPIVKLVCDVVSVIAPSLPEGMRHGLSRFSRGAFRLAAVNQGFSIGKAQRELGYTNLTPFHQGMKETLTSFGTKQPGDRQTVGTV